MAAKDNLSSLEGDMLNVQPEVKEVNGDLAATSHVERVPNAEQNGGKPVANGQPKGTVECDVLVIGAGFSGITAMHRFRKLGLKVKCFEAGGDFGGVWYWNRYPGARVDSEAPYYQLNIPEVWKDWTFSQRFPGHEELRRYMAHIDKVLDLRKDTTFNAQVTDVRWDQDGGRWTVKTADCHTAVCKYVMMATGLLHRKYTPDLPGLSNYKGQLVHSGAYPEDLDCTGKTVGLVGAGATAVQITQEIGKVAKNLDVFLRRPSYCLPMGQRQMSKEEQHYSKSWLPMIFERGRDSRAGFIGGPLHQSAVETPEDERNAHLENMWSRGAFNYLLSGYYDTPVNKDSNKVIYDFWANKVRQRLTDPKKNAIMAPEQMPYYFGTKRTPLENGYYEILNQGNVGLIDLNANPFETFTEKGMKLKDGTEKQYDIIVLATGFDSFTGSMTNMGLKSKDGIDLRDMWKEGVFTYLGLTISGFPNLFMSYTPQAPTALSNGTTIIEAQVETIADMIAKLEKEGAKSIEPQHQAEIEWKDFIHKTSEQTLFPFTSSWWNGGNIPGKKAEGMNYVLGINEYEKQCRATMDGWKGFDVVSK